MNKSEIKSKIQDLFIVREDDGSYNLFGKYIILPQPHGEYLVTLKDDDKTARFYTLRHAVTWCVFEKNRKYKEVNRVHQLDSELGSLDAAIENHKRLLENQSSENKYIYQAKLYEEKLKKRKLLEEINEFAAISKFIQSKKYKENQGI